MFVLKLCAVPGEYDAGALTGRDVRLGTNVFQGTVVNVGAGEGYDTVTIAGRLVDGDSGKRICWLFLVFYRLVPRLELSIPLIFPYCVGCS